MSLTSLPTEIQLTIIHYLHYTAQIVTKLSPSETRGELKKRLASATAFTDTQKVSCLCPLSRSCRIYWNLCSPIINESVVLKNNSRSSASVLALSHSASTSDVKTLHFVGSCPGPDADRHDRWRGEAKPLGLSEIELKELDADVTRLSDCLPEALFTVLSSLNRFPNLQTLMLEFTFDIEDDYVTPVGSIDIFEDKDPVNVVQKEGKWTWQKLLFRVYDSVIQNQTLSASKLELVNIASKKTSVCDKTDWGSFLARFTTITLSISGADNEAGWLIINKTRGYEQFTRNLNRWFFRHMRNTRNFRLEAHNSVPLGIIKDQPDHCPLDFRPGTFLALRSLEIANVFVCKELVTFLQYIRDHLQYLKMENCHACDVGFVDEATTWADFFTHLVSGPFSRLTDFFVEPENPPYYTKVLEMSDQDLEATFRRIKDTLQERNRSGLRRRGFSYGRLDDIYGFWTESGESNRERLFNGEDWQAYQKVVQMVTDNRRREGLKSNGLQGSVSKSIS